MGPCTDHKFHLNVTIGSKIAREKNAALLANASPHAKQSQYNFHFTRALLLFVQTLLKELNIV